MLRTVRLGIRSSTRVIISYYQPQYMLVSYRPELQDHTITAVWSMMKVQSTRKYLKSTANNY